MLSSSWAGCSRPARTPVFIAEGGPRYSWAFRELGLEYYHETFGDRSRVERFFGALKRRTSAFFKDINAGRSRIASLDMLMNMFSAHCNGLRFHEGIGRVPSEVVPLSDKHNTSNRERKP